MSDLLEFEQTDVLCLYGEDAQALVHRFSAWLEQKEQRYLLFLRQDGDFSAELFEHPKVRFLSLNADDEMLKAQLWELLFLRFSYRCFTDEEAHIEEAFARIERCRLGIHLVASDFRDMGARILSNYLTNFPSLERAKCARGLFQSFEGIPALICGAGPTLEADIEQVRAWENRALILAGGSALNVLSNFALMPDMMASIDPAPPLSRFLEQSAFEVPFFYQNRVAQELLAQVQGERLWIADSGGYPVEQWMNSQMNLDEPPFDGGWNVSTFCLALAYALGCRPIILVGVELSSASKRVYAAGVDEKIGAEFIEALDVEGKKVHTKQDWLMAKSWMEEFVLQHPDAQLINATRGGLSINGIPRMSLEQTRQQYGQQMLDIKGMVHTKIKELPLCCASNSQASDTSAAIKESLKRCEKFCEQLLTLFEKSYPILPGEKGEGALLEVELEEEIAYRTFLDPLWQIWRPLFLRDAQAASPYLHRLLFLKRIIHAQRNL